MKKNKDRGIVRQPMKDSLERGKGKRVGRQILDNNSVTIK